MVYSTPVTAVGPGTPAGAILRQYWQPVAVSADLAPGKAKPLRVLGEEFTLYRGESGRAFIVGARCAHRFTWLHTGRIEGDCISCFYHGWKYDGEGKCVEMPAETESFARKVRIPHVPVREYVGLIFGFFGDGVPPPMHSFPQMDDEDNEVIAGIRPPGVWPMNYFQALENGCDPVHTAFVHQVSEPHWNGVPEVNGFRNERGLEIVAMRNGDDKRTTQYYFPNFHSITIYLAAGTDLEFEHFIWQIPVDDENTMMVSATIIPKRLLPRVPAFLTGAGRMWHADSHEQLLSGSRAPESVTEEDYTAMVGQGLIADRTNERLGRSDRVVIMLRHMWSEAIEGLELRAAGVPDASLKSPRPQLEAE